MEKETEKKEVEVETKNESPDIEKKEVEVETKNESPDIEAEKNNELETIKNELEKLRIEKLDSQLSKVLEQWQIDSFAKEFSKSTYGEKEKIAKFIIENFPEKQTEQKKEFKEERFEIF